MNDPFTLQLTAKTAAKSAPANTEPQPAQEGETFDEMFLQTAQRLLEKPKLATAVTPDAEAVEDTEATKEIDAAVFSPDLTKTDQLADPLPEKDVVSDLKPSKHVADQPVLTAQPKGDTEQGNSSVSVAASGSLI
ncbi:MAG: hypothetical protein WBC93_17080, partial [Sulfitobacter sp.]